MKCDCWLGILNAYDQSDMNDLRLSNFRSLLIERSSMSKLMANHVEGLGFKAFEPKDYIDRRRGLAALFNYCPLCGLKINWKTIKKEISA